MGKHLGVAYNLRLPQELKDKIAESAKELNRSMNADIVARLEESFFKAENSSTQGDVKIFDLKNGRKRIVYGKLVNSFELDYSKSLSELKLDIELSLNALSRSSFWKSIKFFNKNVIVHQGNNHLDVVDNGVGSLNWLIIEDHYVNRDQG
ncbi:Arc family DNA-binding protein [Acinetobacter sp. YH12073]|uniref:Arc family DNA-binding protein n=1 Tax=Acinetobacter sp. YH12073 TaxID=2601069 RepID=UPI0015D1814F|nr:Arc family DNA-binding protein [Acinetobacter sp. YH12073]